VGELTPTPGDAPRRVLLDSSVTIAFLERGDALHRRARAALERHAGAELLVSVLTYAETLVRPLAHGGSVLETVEGFMREAILRIEPVTPTIARRAAGMRSTHRGLRLVDALIVATGEEVDADRILTADARWASASDRVELVVG
jgi:predicted nucleic acid-binding protein